MTRVRVSILTIFAFAAAVHVSARPAEEPPSACELLSEQDVAAVQGEPFSGTKLTSVGGKSQCFYELPSFVNSVSVDVLREGAGDYWRQYFSKEAQAKRDKKREGKRKKEGPKFVSGVGQEAFWTGNRTGSLYVFDGDAVLRISVGGGGTEAEKIARTKKLAAKALRRM